MEDFKKKNAADMNDKEIVFSQSIKAGKRIYYLDVKKNRKDEMFLAITESKKIVMGEGDDSQVSFEKHKIFLYKEDFEKFMNGLQQAIGFIQEQQGCYTRHTTDEEAESPETGKEELPKEEKASSLEGESNTKIFKMKSIEVKGTARTIAERSSEQARALKAIRKNNGVPCVLYGAGENVHFTVPAEGLRNLVYTPHIYVVDLVIDGKKVNAIMKDIQFHPVKDTILHVDFYQIDEAKPIVMEVPVQMEGLAEGVKAGGKLVLQMRKLKVRALYNVIPERLIINVAHLGLGKTVKVGELQYEGLELLNAKEAVVCAVKLTRAARGAAAAAGN